MTNQERIVLQKCPALHPDHSDSSCPILGECIKYRMPLHAQVKLASMIDAMETKHWYWVLLVRLGRLVRKFRKEGNKNGTTDGRGSSQVA